MLYLSNLDFGSKPDPEPEDERFARILAGDRDRDRDGDDIASLAADMIGASDSVPTWTSGVATSGRPDRVLSAVGAK